MAAHSEAGLSGEEGLSKPKLPHSPPPTVPQLPVLVWWKPLCEQGTVMRGQCHTQWCWCLLFVGEGAAVTGAHMTSLGSASTSSLASWWQLGHKLFLDPFGPLLCLAAGAYGFLLCSA